MAGKFRANAPMVSLSRPQFTCIPSDPCRHAVGGTRPQDGTCTAPLVLRSLGEVGTLVAGWCRVNPTSSGFHGVEHSSTSLNIPQAPHRLFQGSVQQQTIERNVSVLSHGSLKAIYIPPTTHIQPPSAFQVACWLRSTQKSTSEALPKTRPSVVSALVRQSASLDALLITEVNTPSKAPKAPRPSGPRKECCRILHPQTLQMLRCRLQQRSN